jgi:5-methylcytosine-specific restriction protein A
MGRVRHRACPIDGRIDCLVHIPSRRGRSGATQRKRAAYVQEYRDTFGEVCPGWGVPPHAVVPPNRLSADHVLPRSLGGEHGDLAVLCIECNSRRGQG